MLLNTNDLKGYSLGAEDGEIGSVRDFYFDDSTWTVRYLVVGTGSWLSGRTVLISPIAVKGVEEGAGPVRVSLTREQIRNSPAVQEDKPVSKQYEEKYYDYYRWPIYWGDRGRWGAGAYPSVLSAPGPEITIEDASRHETWDPNLRSVGEIEKYAVHAIDGELGQVTDFLVDDESWAVRFMVVDTRPWWPGGNVLVSPHWVNAFRWELERVDVDLRRDTIRNAPPYEQGTAVGPDYERRLFEYYGRAEDRAMVHIRPEKVQRV